MNTDQILETLKRMEMKIDQLVAKQPMARTRTVVERHDSRTDLTRKRVAEIERIFWNIVNGPRDKRAKSYRFPKVLLEKTGKPHIEAVLTSVLINQAAMRRSFTLKGLGDPAGETAAQCARRLLDQTNLIQLPLYHTRLDYDSATLVSFSPGEAERCRKTAVPLPVFKGWTTRERAIAQRSPFSQDFIQPPEDPCGEREWGDVVEEESEEEEEEEEEEAPAKPRVTVDREAFASVTSEDSEEDEEDADELLDEDESGAEVDFGDDETEIDTTPQSYYRQRVQFVEDES